MLELEIGDHLLLKHPPEKLAQVGAVDFRGFKGDASVVIYLFEYADEVTAIANLESVSMAVGQWRVLENIHCVRYANMVMIVGTEPGDGLNDGAARAIEMYLGRFS